MKRLERIKYILQTIKCCFQVINQAPLANKLIWTFLAGYFVMAPFAYLFIYVPELYKTRLRATAFAFVVQTGRILTALACLLSGQLVGLFGGSYAKAGAAVATLYVLALIATFFMPESQKEVSKDQLASR